YEILHERDDDDTERPDKRQKSGDRHKPTSQQSSHRNHGHNNDRHGSDRRSDSDNHRSSNNNYSGSNNRNSGYRRDQRNRGQQSNRSTNSGSQQSRGPSEGYSYPANKKLGASGRVFAITEGHAANTSALQARTLLYHGSEGFLATIHDTTPEVLSIHNQPIVSEFLDVFPDELPGIPPVREFEFNIELIPGAKPISKASYCMAPVELKELKDQLQELLER
nr:putative reverse transcriptase domain, aspartic peptidase domain protein [Tanacetum cinerariifolium]